MRLLPYLVLGIINTSCYAQSALEKSLGGWSGQFVEENAFNFTLELSQRSSSQYQLDLKGNDAVSSFQLNRTEDDIYRGQEADVKVTLKMASESPTLFIHVGHHLCHVPLKSEGGSWIGKWNLLILEDIRPTLYLSLNKEDGIFNASPFFKEPSLHYMWGQKFVSEGTGFRFQDIRSTIEFEGSIDKDKIRLTMMFLNERSEVILRKFDFEQWNLGSFENGKTPEQENWDSRFQNLIDAIRCDTLEGTHSVVIRYCPKKVCKAR